MLKSKVFIPISFDGNAETQYKHDFTLIFLENSGEIEKCSFLVHDLTWFDMS